VQRIAYASNEANYCARCQIDGRLLADRGLSRLMHGDWPKTLDELEERKASGRNAVSSGAAPVAASDRDRPAASGQDGDRAVSVPSAPRAKRSAKPRRRVTDSER
jgi:hypothetical protein